MIKTVGLESFGVIISTHTVCLLRTGPCRILGTPIRIEAGKPRPSGLKEQ